MPGPNTSDRILKADALNLSVNSFVTKNLCYLKWSDECNMPTKIEIKNTVYTCT